MNLSTAGGDISAARFQMTILVVQTIVYFILACTSIFLENWVIRNIDKIRETRDDLAQLAGIDREEDARIIKGS
jgi:hypothetical protein